MTTDASSASGYELVDFGHGAKLERFGIFTIQRPCPGAERCVPTSPGAWRRSDAIFQRDPQGPPSWTLHSQIPDSWNISLEGLTLQLRLTTTGQVGVFPEQRENWRWLARQVRRARRPLRVLNLFAYTGGSTLASALAGAFVTHVDAARSAVAWARKNAVHMNVPRDRIGWITDDARKYVQREVRRGRRYDAVILDPPSYGHGSRQEPWKIERDLPQLLADCRLVLSQNPAFVLVTCHSPAFRMPELQAAVDSFLFHSCLAGSHVDRLGLRTSTGRELPAGIVVRWPKETP